MEYFTKMFRFHRFAFQVMPADCQSLVKDLVWNLSLLVEIVTSLCKLIVLQKGAC